MSEVLTEHIFRNKVYQMKDATFIPIYFTFLIKTLRKFDVAGSVEMNYTLIMRVPKVGVPVSILNKIKEKGIALRFNEVPVEISPENPQVVLKDIGNMLIFNYRCNQTVDFFITLNTTPFDRICFKFQIELTSQVSEGGDHFRFNIHKNFVDPCSNLSIKPNTDQIHDFNIDYSQNNIVLKNEKKNDKNGNLDYEYVPVVEYCIGLYRQPEAILTTLFFPIYLLIFLVYLVFYQNGSMDSKIANLATILLAILAYQQVFRSVIPITPKITFGDTQIILSILSVLLVAVDAYIQEYYPGTDQALRCRTTTLTIMSVFNGLFVLVTCIAFIRYRILKRKMDERPIQPKRFGTDHDYKEWFTSEIRTGHDNKEHKVLGSLIQ